jgi:hypothetical protein
MNSGGLPTLNVGNQKDSEKVAYLDQKLHSAVVEKEGFLARKTDFFYKWSLNVCLIYFCLVVNFFSLNLFGSFQSFSLLFRG